MLHTPRIAAETATAPAPLLLLPGTLCDGREFAPVSNAFERRTLMWRLSGAKSTPDMADAILEDAPEHFALCGFSLGAVVALEIAVRAPHRVERLALIAGRAGAFPAAGAAGKRAERAQAEQDGVAALLPSDAPEVLRAMAEATSLATFRDQVDIALVRNDNRGNLGTLTMPTLVMCGADDTVTPPELSRELADGILGARLAIIPSAGHYVTLDQPEAAARELRRWLSAPTTDTTAI